MPVALAAMRDLLLPGLWGVDGKYPQIPRQWPDIFKQTESEMAFERKVSMRYLGYAQIKQEAGPTSFDNQSGQRYVYNAEHFEIGLGYGISRKSLDDNLYKAEFSPSNDGLTESFKETEEVFCANLFNLGTVYNPQVGGDLQALFSTNHPIDGATIANQPSPDLSLNETSILNACIAIRTNWKDNAGLKIRGRARKLVVPTTLEPVAYRLFKSELRVGTGTNDANAVVGMEQSLREGYMIWDYLTLGTSWFLLTNHAGLIFFHRKRFESDMTVEFSTDNLLVKGYQRYTPSYHDWRAVWGTYPTN